VSADPFVQAPYHSQSLNRYSYVWNNPLTLVDPSGFGTCGVNGEDFSNGYFCGFDQHMLEHKDRLWASETLGSAQGWIYEGSNDPQLPVSAAAAEAFGTRSEGLSPAPLAQQAAPREVENYAALSATGLCSFMPEDCFTGISRDELDRIQQDRLNAGLFSLPVPPLFQGSKWGIGAVRAWWISRWVSKLPFKSGEYIIREFQTSAGILDVGAQANIVGRTLHLEGIAVYPRGAKAFNLGMREMLKVRAQLAAEARALGFHELRITGIRLTGANPGKLPDVIIDLTK
jgi:hypothetical protein